MPRFRRARRARTLRRQRITAGAWVYCVLMVAGSIGFRASTAPASDSLDDQLTRLEGRNATLAQTANELRIELAKLRSDNAEAPLPRQPDFSRLLRLIGEACHERAVVRELDLTLESGGWLKAQEPESLVLRIRGVTPTQSDAWGFALEIERAELFDGVRLVNTQRTELLGQEMVAFDLECTIDGGGAP